ncbi:TetR/AcrR family transcriptional regulator [Micromonospora sp. WP24]|uniref:TetR/AcrR family transcriptional regulator n=1 Tax=Micromonospora sp. WP24 TaxID=2604469 RepID=UPI0011D7BCB8|nr:TetR family transcriptional regulator [Micromonospora sp. WP24]TYC01211.1 TetR/AcrR family transcriptional regulator [Micromonospora sp. WP24]
MSPRDSADTRNRILQAAIAEFSAVGLAGARVDRIAANAKADKKLIYVYFHDKESLFSATLDRVLQDLIEAVPVDEKDLPGFAGRLFDYIHEHPEALRLSMWRQLERATLGPSNEAAYAAKVTAMESGDDTTRIDGVPPVDLLVLIQGMAGAWMQTPRDLLTADGSDPDSPERIATHRRALITAVERLTRPTP